MTGGGDLVTAAPGTTCEYWIPIILVQHATSSASFRTRKPIVSQFLSATFCLTWKYKYVKMSQSKQNFTTSRWKVDKGFWPPPLSDHTHLFGIFGARRPARPLYRCFRRLWVHRECHGWITSKRGVRGPGCSLLQKRIRAADRQEQWLMMQTTREPWMDPGQNRTEITYSFTHKTFWPGVHHLVTSPPGAEFSLPGAAEPLNLWSSFVS